MNKRAMNEVHYGNVGPGKRVFIYAMYERGPGYIGHSKYVNSNFNSRGVACVMFRKIYGSAPDISWGCGFMAEAFDKRGRKVQITCEHKIKGDWK